MLSTEIAKLEQECKHLREENKELREQFRKHFSDEPQLPMKCGVCKFYLQHYIYSDGYYKKTNCGHCIHGKSLQERKPDDQKCKYFELESS